MHIILLVSVILVLAVSSSKAYLVPSVLQNDQNNELDSNFNPHEFLKTFEKISKSKQEDFEDPINRVDVDKDKASESNTNEVTYFEQPRYGGNYSTISLSNIVKNILSVLNLGLVSSFDECARITSSVEYSLELTKKAILDLQIALKESLHETKSTCFHLHFFDCVRDIIKMKFRNFKIKDQFFLLAAQIVLTFDQIGKCGKQISY
uniref:Uncharacterized protein n=1 Tax=Cacopsylla melanoneura TaxID=428564 RepID=A0A8D8XXS2_9HEMI